MNRESSYSTTEVLGCLMAMEGLTVKPQEPLKRHSTFRIGGPAEWLVEVARAEALGELLTYCHTASVPWQILGLGSNVLFPDAGVAGVVVRLSGDFRRFELDGSRVLAGAALGLAQVAKRTASAGLTGLEALSGFPSTVGGAVHMNAGCYGTEICEVLESALLVEADGSRRRVTPADLNPGYRTTNLQGTDAIVTEAVFQLVPGDPAQALAKIEKLNRRRWASLPAGVANAGSVFRNPEGDFAGRLVDDCGLKGRRSGGARISPKHGNVIVNEGDAKAVDVLDLMFQARKAVKARFEVDLVPELILVGSLRRKWEQGSA